MIRGMFRRYDSGYDSPYLLYTVYIRLYPISKGSLLHQAGDWGCFLKGPTGPWQSSKARFGYDSGYVSDMIRGMTRAGDFFVQK